MSQRKRKHIPMIEIAASALADKLSIYEREIAKERRLPAREVVRLFTPDHLDLHCLGGVDRWYNLDMRRRGPDLKSKDQLDIARAAKVKRINEKWGPFMRAIAAGRKPPKKQSRWPKRKLRSRRQNVQQRGKGQRSRA